MNVLQVNQEVPEVYDHPHQLHSHNGSCCYRSLGVVKLCWMHLENLNSLSSGKDTSLGKCGLYNNQV